jgi:Right handed beta helix region
VQVKLSKARWQLAIGVVSVALVVPGGALAHLERPSYWPDPAPDTSVDPPAGGRVPEARSLRSAVTGAGPGEVRVVCQGPKGIDSLRLALRSIRQARKRGFRIRPSQAPVRYSRRQARRMRVLNQKLRRRCGYHSIQRAVSDSGNNDRIVIMPGRYTEPESRAQPGNDPRCNPGLLQRDASGDFAPSYAYQVTCPNDQNLVYVQGRALAGEPLAQPRPDRQGIPNQELGACVRCNLQIEGSGPKPADVIVDAGERYQGSGPSAKPLEHAKHVVLRVDRADGFVGRNFLLRGGLEFGFYTEETDGVLLDRTKFYWNADYGHLSFTTDHHLVKNCDGMGAGDAAIYPGAAPETGSQATDFYPDAPRANTVITRCDMRNSALGYSGSMGNAVRITNNHIYGNTTGIASDTLSSAGHPGFPADSSEIDHNFIYSNNFNVYAKDSPVKPLVMVPVGTGIVYAGMNDAKVHDNWIFDNWRDGAMLLAVPDALTSYGGAEGQIHPGISCAGAPENGISTSCGNRYSENRMGQAPPGFAFPAAVDLFGAPHSGAGATLPNGNDFWWDEFPTNRWNCWYANTGPDGAPGSVSGSGEAGRTPGIPPNPLPDCAGGQDPGLSVGTGDVAKEAYLVDCSEGPDEETGPLDCDWWTPPPPPGSAAARARQLEFARAALAFEGTPEALRLRGRMEELAGGG